MWAVRRVGCGLILRGESWRSNVEVRGTGSVWRGGDLTPSWMVGDEAFTVNAPSTVSATRG